MAFRDTIRSSVDYLVSLWNPTQGARRAHLRRMEDSPEYAQMFAAIRSAGYGYNVAGSATATPWGNSGRSADAEIHSSLPRLISRSRELNRTDPVASGLTRTFVSNVVGKGFMPQAATDNEDWNTAIETVFNERRDDLAPAEDLTHAEYQRMAYGKTLEDGGLLVKMAKANPREDIWFENVEVDRLWSLPGAKDRDTGNRITDGVEKDKHGRVTAYHVLERHPGETGWIASGNTHRTQRVLKDVTRHLKRSDLSRPGQSRGVPFTHAVLQDLRDMDLLIVAGLKRSQIAASLAAFITTDSKAEEVFDTVEESYGHRLKQNVEPGMLFKLYPGENIETLVPNFPTPEFVPFITLLARRIGAAIGVSWQVVLKDFSSANYSSARTDLLEARQVWTKEAEWFVDKFLAWQWRVVLEDAKLMGHPLLRTIPIEELRKVRWILQGWRWVDPQKEASATQQRLDMGLTTLRDEAGAQGMDWRDLVRQGLIEEQFEAQLREEMGLAQKSRIRHREAPTTTMTAKSRKTKTSATGHPDCAA